MNTNCVIYQDTYNAIVDMVKKVGDASNGLIAKTKKQEPCHLCLSYYYRPLEDLKTEVIQKLKTLNDLLKIHDDLLKIHDSDQNNGTQLKSEYEDNASSRGKRCTERTESEDMLCRIICELEIVLANLKYHMNSPKVNCKTDGIRDVNVNMVDKEIQNLSEKINEHIDCVEEHEELIHLRATGNSGGRNRDSGVQSMEADPQRVDMDVRIEKGKGFFAQETLEIATFSQDMSDLSLSEETSVKTPHTDC